MYNRLTSIIFLVLIFPKVFGQVPIPYHQSFDLDLNDAGDFFWPHRCGDCLWDMETHEGNQNPVRVSFINTIERNFDGNKIVKILVADGDDDTGDQELRLKFFLSMEIMRNISTLGAF